MKAFGAGLGHGVDMRLGRFNGRKRPGFKAIEGGLQRHVV